LRDVGQRFSVFRERFLDVREDQPAEKPKYRQQDIFHQAQ
jgi:hypothetical protein